MTLIIILSAIITIVVGLLEIVERLHSYIEYRRQSKIDPSSRFPAPDGSDDDKHK